MQPTSPKPFAFVLMPFKEEFRDIYEVGIKPACNDAGAYCERVDEQIFTESILERVYNQIAKADIVISELTGQNPNVFYETGYAHALNKRTILLTQNSSDIPFDLKHYPHIIYGTSISSLKSKLEATIRWCIDNPTTPISTANFNPDVYINAQQLQVDIPTDIHLPFNFSYVLSTKDGVKHHIPRSDTVGVQLGIHNSSNRVYSGNTIIGVISTPIDRLRVDTNGIEPQVLTRLPDDKQLVTFRKITELLPNAWESYQIAFQIDHSFEGPSNLTHEITIRVFTEFGSKDYPIRIHITLNKSLLGRPQT